MAATPVPDEAISSVEAQQSQNEVDKENTTTELDVEMTEVPVVTGTETDEHIKEPKAEEADARVKDLPPHPDAADNAGQEALEQASTNGETGETFESREKPDEMETSKDGEKTENSTHEDETEQGAEMQDGSSPEPPRRMTTRAQANAANPENGNGSPSSLSDTADTLPTPHPLFLIPDQVRPDANFGLPPAEAEETRRLLWSYIQKQEETVRGFEHMLDSLLRACHMKSDVLDWSKAEGHVGEMSDGEDWYDREKWGLAEGEELKKGTDEDDVETVDESRATAKRSRARRA